MPSMKTAKPYHHGDLRNAIIDAALDLLAEKGVDGLSLRQCAARAGVSHGAPAHHFGDLQGVLTAIAAIGFDLLTESMNRSQKAGGPTAYERLCSTGAGYVKYALKHPHHFSLMFQSDLVNFDDPVLCEAAQIAYQVLTDAIAAIYPPEEKAQRDGRDAMWSIVHGYAQLILAGQIDRPPSINKAVQSLISPLILQ